MFLSDDESYFEEIKELKGNDHTYEVISDKKIDTIIIDPQRDIYDSNRFNNTNIINGLKFFPGNAKNLYDDQYLLTWVPNISREPSRGIRYGLSGSLFKYLNRPLDFNFMIDQDNKLNTFSIRSQSEPFIHNSKLVLGFSQQQTGIQSIGASMFLTDIVAHPYPSVLSLVPILT